MEKTSRLSRKSYIVSCSSQLPFRFPNRSFASTHLFLALSFTPYFTSLPIIPLCHDEGSGILPVTPGRRRGGPADTLRPVRRYRLYWPDKLHSWIYVHNTKPLLRSMCAGYYLGGGDDVFQCGDDVDGRIVSRFSSSSRVAGWPRCFGKGT